MSLFEQLKRRNVIRIAAAYLAVSWLLVQIAETLLPVFGFGNGPIRILVIVLAIGFLPALILSWLFELTPEGIKRDEEVDHSQPASIATRERLNQVVIVSLLLAVGYFAIDKFVLSGAVPETESEEVAIAVMPFNNLSDSDDTVFFSDGVAEDILGLLAQLDGLRCIARSSSFALRDPDLGAAEIGERLGVTHVLTGSLRSVEDQIRVSVRLIDIESESVVWSESYDRHLDDVFAIQDEISRHIVGSIAPALTSGLRSVEGPSDPRDYVDYLRARHTYLRGRDNSDTGLVLEARKLYDELLLRSPTYAKAYAGLADVWNELAIQAEVGIEDGYSRAREFAERAIDIDPDVAEAWYALGDILIEHEYDFPAAAVAYEKAIAVAPQDADGLRGYGYFLRSAGRADQAIDVYLKTLELDPFSTRGWEGLYRSYLDAGRFDEAEAWLRETIPAGAPDAVFEAINVWVHEAQRDYGRVELALDAVDQILPGPWPAYFHALVARHNGDVETADATIRSILDMELREGLPPNWIVARYHALFGEFDTSLEYLDRAAANNEIGLGEALHDRNFADLRKDPRFWSWVSRAGIKPLD